MNYLALGFVVLFGVIILIFNFTGRPFSIRDLRKISGFRRLSHAIGLAVENGTRLHVNAGRGDLTSSKSAAGFAGLSMMRRITQVASVSDNPPIASTGDGTLNILAQDALRSSLRDIDVDRANDQNARLVGLTPFSYAAGAIPIIEDEEVSATILAGSFGSEVALMTEASERSGGFLLGGSDNLVAQAIMYAAAQETLIGEELFAGGAYVNAGGLHIASLRTQDVFRIGITVFILVGGLLKFFGFF